MILLGGITINRNSTHIRRGGTQNGNPDSVNRSELVLASKAKVVSIRGKSSTALRSTVRPINQGDPAVLPPVPTPVQRPAAGAQALIPTRSEQLPGPVEVPQTVARIGPVRLQTADTAILDAAATVADEPAVELPMRLSRTADAPPLTRLSMRAIIAEDRQ